MKLKINKCLSCGKMKPIVNKKYNLCNSCNYKRLHPEGRKAPFKPFSHKSNTKPPKRIKNRSETRLEHEKIYENNKRLKKEYLIKEDKFRCVFCNARLRDEEDNIEWHHLLGRTGTLLYEWDNINPAHHQCHSDYHKLKAEKLIKLPWYYYFLNRIRHIAEVSGKEMFVKLYNKELLRLHKAGIYDQETYFKMML